ncbi:hypothetical protein MAM1_0197c07781 [Mucor ambiguus]|uniref:Uncharacterized protein n=1 Tax=Mucor ambiguus TaxID=91626 RepID=A0A0C9N141_9FUNG|nr:hypothetical protein MAM1_0197c07781 [Mucor ambiguus]
MSNNSNLDLTLAQQQASLTASERMFQELEEICLTLSSLTFQLLQACKKTTAQKAKNQLMGKRNNSLEQHVTNAKRLSDALNAKVIRYVALTLAESEKIALHQNSLDEFLHSREREELVESLNQFLAVSRNFDTLCTALLDRIHTAPVSSLDVLESKL